MSPICFRFFRVPLVRNGVAALSLASLLVCPSGAVSPVEPAWWAQYEAVDPYGQSDDFAAANVGQLKYIASRAAAALNDVEAATQAPLTASQLQAKTAIDTMLAMWDQPPLPDVIRDDFQALNAGQLKQVASLFYDRLGLPHPWPAVSTDDHQMVNVGQLKHVFAFDPRFRGAVVAATIPASLLQAAVDAWNALPTKPAGSSLDDFDGDGIPNLQQYLSGRPLLDPADLDGDRIPDSVETASGGILDPLRFADAVADYDNDGVMNHEELLLALTLGSATTPARTDTLEDAAVLVWSLPLGRPLIPRVDPLRTFWEGIDAAWLDEQVGPGYESWLEDQDLNTNGLPDGLEAFRTAALVDFTWSPYPDIGTIQYPPLAYDPAGGTIDADQDGNPDFDRDADTLPDLWEYRYQLDPRDPGDATLDPDQDGLNNLAEYLAGTHPRLADSDGDGFTDGEEWNASSPASNPLAAASVPPLVLAIGSGSGQQIPVGSTSAAPLIAHVTQGARPRQGAEVTFSVTSGSSSIYSASLAQASTSLTVTTDTQGNAPVNLLAGSTTGPAVVTATLTSGGQPVTFALIITAAPPAYGIGSPASPYGTSSGVASQPAATHADPWDAVYVIWGYQSMGVSFFEKTPEEGEASSNFGGHIATYTGTPSLRGFKPGDTDRTEDAKTAFQDQPFSYSVQGVDTSLPIMHWGPPSVVERTSYAVMDNTYEAYNHDGVERFKQTTWGMTSLRLGTYSDQAPLGLTFVVLVEVNKESAYPLTPSEKTQTVAVGSLRFQGRNVAWSDSLKTVLRKGNHTGEVILDPGNAEARKKYLPDIKNGFISICLVPIDIEPDAGMAGIIGNVVKSAKPNSTIKHFVTPKKSTELPQEYVELKAVGVDENKFSELFEWEGGLTGSAANKRRVLRGLSKMNEIKIKAKGNGIVVAQMNVWVVWSQITIAHHATGVFEDIDPDQSIYGIPDNEAGPWRFVASITPKEIVTVQEKPKLNGRAIKPAPGANNPHPVYEGRKADYAEFCWDFSRKVRFTYTRPGVSDAELQSAGLPLNVSWPSEPNEGNDDPPPDLAEDNNPYEERTGRHWGHPIGSISSHDLPKIPIPNSFGKNENQIFELHIDFKEFARLEIYDGARTSEKYWFVISDPFAWHISFKGKFQNGRWRNNSSNSSQGNVNH